MSGERESSLADPHGGPAATSRDCKYSITFLGCFIPLSLTSFATAFAMALPSTPNIWQLVRIKHISCLVNKLLFVRKANLMCSRASSLDLFTSVLEETPLTMAMAAVVLPVTDRQLSGGEGGRKGGEGGLAWVRR